VRPEGAAAVASVGGGVRAERAVGEGDGPTGVADGAATEPVAHADAVAGEGAVGHGQRALVDDAAAGVGSVVRQGAVRDGHGARDADGSGFDGEPGDDSGSEAGGDWEGDTNWEPNASKAGRKV